MDLTEWPKKISPLISYLVWPVEQIFCYSLQALQKMVHYSVKKSNNGIMDITDLKDQVPTYALYTASEL